ncbi:aldo/keto reductase [Microlunatus spumicola]|uniref:aldo/keto reductase n=1 Tax=Microlunatus spumicola TaxID=81499 RepID=UPI00195CA38E
MPAATFPLGQPKGLALGGTGVPEHPGGQANADVLVAAAWEDGVRYFDTAPMYGGGVAERLMGRALAAYPRADLVLSSKVGRLVRGDEPVPPGEDPLWRFDFSADGIRRSVEESLERLGVDRLDVAFVHDPDAFLALVTRESYPALERLRDEGLVGRIGVGVCQVPTLLHLLRETRVEVALLAGRLSLVDGEAVDEVLPLVAEQGVTLVVASVLHAGLVDGRDSGQLHYAPTPPEVVLQVAAIKEVCDRHGTPIGAAALQFVLARPEVAMALTGAVDVDQWRQNLAWSRWPVPAKLWRDLAAAGLLSSDLPPALVERASTA